MIAAAPSATHEATSSGTGLPYWLEGLAFGAFVAVTCLLQNHFASTVYDNYSILARAFLQGHVWVSIPGAYIDAQAFGGRYYMIEAPFPGILMMPFVAAFGYAANQTFLAVALAGLAAAVAWDICRTLGLSRGRTALLAIFFVWGTDLAWCALYGDVWFLAHVASVAFTLLALREVIGARRGWLVALFAAAAFESRFSLVLAVPAYAALLLALDEPRTRVRNALAFAGVLVPVACAHVGYNFARWGVPSDIGYTLWYHHDDIGQPTGSPFRLGYVPDELYSFFVRAPAFYDRFPYVAVDRYGLSLPFTSPALALAFFADRPRRTVAALWVATLLVAAPSILYYANGTSQFGMRHALDFEPFLFLLMAYAARKSFSWLAVVAIVYSVAVGFWGIWFWDHYIRLLAKGSW